MSKSAATQRKDFKARYAGPLSAQFWNRVNALPHSENRVIYNLGCALQDLEHRVLTSLNNAERAAESKRKP